MCNLQSWVIKLPTCSYLKGKHRTLFSSEIAFEPNGRLGTDSGIRWVWLTVWFGEGSTKKTWVRSLGTFSRTIKVLFGLANWSQSVLSNIHKIHVSVQLSVAETNLIRNIFAFYEEIIISCSFAFRRSHVQSLGSLAKRVRQQVASKTSAQDLGELLQIRVVNNGLGRQIVWAGISVPPNSPLQMISKYISF